MNNNLKENTTHGDFNLPFTTYHGESCDKIMLIPMHWHEEFEIAYIETGTCEVKVDLNDYVAEPGDIVIIKPFSLHSMKGEPQEKMSWHSMVFNMSILQSALTDGCAINYIVPIINNETEFPLIINSSNKHYKEISECINTILKCYQSKGEAYELEIKSLLFHLFFILFKNNLVKKTVKSHKLSENSSDKIKDVLNYIANNYTNQISIYELAEISDFSEFHFMKFFKKHIGMTCVEYMNLYRLGKASELLANTNMSIMDVSLDVGFNSVSYFNKLFKSTFNMTPKEFRMKTERG